VSSNHQVAGTAPLPPHLLSYAITKKCNLRCKHCYNEAMPGRAADELSTEEAKRVLDEVAAWGIKLLIFDGGEPLCRNDFFDIAGYASSNGLRAVMGSNGTLIDTSTAEQLKYSGVMAVQISIDGADAKTHDWFRGEDGAFTKALAGAEACRTVGLAFQFGMTIRKGNLDQIPEMLRLAVELGATAAEFFDLVEVPRVKREIPDEILTPAERKDVMEWLAQAQEDCPIVIRVPGCPMYTLLLQHKGIRPKHFPASLLKRIPYYERGCAAGMPNGYVTVLPNGDVIPCMLLQVKLGNVRQQHLTDIWCNSPLLSQLRNRNLLQEDCGRCSYRNRCAGCRGRAYEKTGNILASDPGCWFRISAT